MIEKVTVGIEDPRESMAFWLQIYCVSLEQPVECLLNSHCFPVRICGVECVWKQRVWMKFDFAIYYVKCRGQIT